MVKSHRPKQPIKNGFKPLALSIKIILVSSMSTLAWLPTAQAEITQSASQVAQQFTIPAGSLSQVLARLSAQAGIYLVGASELASGKSSEGLQGSYTVENALSQILNGSGLVAVAQGDNSYALHKEANQDDGQSVTLSTLQVQGLGMDGSAANAYRVGDAFAGALGNMSKQNTPFTIETYSEDYISNLQARSLGELTKFDAAISLSGNNLITENNAFAIRGISTDFDTGQKLDGMNFRSRAKDLPLEHLERVEILKGAGGFLYGFAAPGGIINYVLKRPTDEFKASVSTQLMDSGLLLAHGDVGGRAGPEDIFGYRVNVVSEAGDTYVDDGEAYRKSASAAIDWRITPDLIWQADALISERKSYGGYFSINPTNTFGKVVSPIDGDKRLAPDWTRYESEHITTGSDLIWNINNNWNNKLSYRYSTSYRNPLMPILYVDGDGNYSATLFNYNNLFKSYQTQNVLSGVIETGPVTHNMAFGLSHTRTISSNSSGIGTLSIPLGSGNLSSPVDFDRPVGHLDKSDASFNEYSRITRKEAFMSDTLNVGESWDFIIGARYGSLEDDYGDYKESEITPSFAAIYRPLEWMSIYASYVEAFEQGATAPNTAVNAGEVFQPLVSKQYETGIKVDYDNWSANMAIFQLERGLTFTDGNNVFSQDGEAHFEGIELSTRGKITEQWMVGASAMWLDATNKKTTNPSLEGEPIQGVADKQFRLYSEYQLPNTQLTFTGGAQYTSSVPLDVANQWQVGSVTLFDLGARYEIDLNKQLLTLRLNVENLTDKAYWLTSAGSSGIAQGAPRTIKLGAQLDF
ncbi:TonB-dependent siderophore receptor [Methylophaga sp.]|uniref:TonB-dependent siderophore receptor n=1 Tax=Methylophaga sp. TaxID=2024840 RepID=UPI003A941DF7